MNAILAAPAQPKKKILLVDDEKLSLDLLQEFLEVSFPEVEVLCATDGIEALALLDREEVDLLITDLYMPRLDGLGLMAKVAGRELAFPIIVTTAFGRSDIEQSVRNLGGVFYFEKPIDLDLLQVTAERLLRANRGEVSAITLRGFAQFVAGQHKTGRLEVRGQGRFGTLHFVNGVLIDASTAAGLESEEAALEILSWDEVELHFATGLAEEARSPAIGTSFSDLVTAASRRREKTTQPVQMVSRASVLAGSLENPSSNKEPNMADVKESLNVAMTIDGAIGAALVDYTSGMCLGFAGGNSNLNIEVAAAANTAVVRAKMKVIKDLNLKETIEDILITLNRQYHLLRPLRKSPNLFLYLATDRDRSNLALARHKLNEIEDNLSV